MIKRNIPLAICVLALTGIAHAQDTNDAQTAASAIVSPPPVEEKQPEGIEITAETEASFDSQKNLAIFIGNVEVKDVRFNLRADKLIAYLDPEEGGLERAEATGNVRIVQIPPEGTDAKATRSTGRGAKAVYEPKTGTVTLTGWPQVKQGINLHKATEASTRMVLNPDGRMKTFGQSKTIIQDKTGAP